MTVDEAFAEFRARSLSIAKREPDEQVSSDSPEVRISALASQSGDAGLRLVFNDDAGVITLEISHGPPEGGVAGWMNLFQASVVETELVTTSEVVTFDSAVDYGLELMGFEVAAKPQEHGPA